MHSYRVIFCDIDGTLLGSDYNLAPGNVRAVREVVEAGTPFILVSARMPDAMYAIQDELGVKAPMVCYGGALVLDRLRQPVHSVGVDPAVAIAVKKRVADVRPAVASCVYSFGQWIVDDLAEPRIAKEIRIVNVQPLEGSVESRITPGNEVHKIFCAGDPEDIDAVATDLPVTFPDLAVLKSSPNYLEIMNKAVSKATAVEFICRAMRIPIRESVAFGDNYNDADMLAAAGLGVAMGNAPEEVKAQADRVALSNDEEGVRAMLESLEFQPMAHSIRYNRKG